MRRALLVPVLAAAWLCLPGCAPTGPAARDSSREGPACTSNLECAAGEECIRPQGQLNGLCGRLVDAHGNPTTSIRRKVQPCENDFDCPVRFRCERTSATVGICVTQ
jgi:hypothetical protein